MSHPKRLVERYWPLVALVAAVLLLGLGVLVGARVKSPRQAMADAQPPPLSLVTTKLQERELVSEVVTRGRPSRGGGVTVKAGAGLAGPDAVVTAVRVAKSDELRSGRVVLEISGSPLIAAVLDFRPYRDLSVGDRGPDVRQMSAFLARQGYLAAGRDTADAAMRQAAWRFLKDRGYDGVLGGKAGDKAGLVMKRQWLLRLDRAGRKVTSVGVKLGSEVSDPDAVLLVCDATPPVVQVRLDRTAVARLRIHDTARVVDDATHRTVEAEVAEIDARETADEESGATGRLVTLTALAGSSFSGLPEDIQVSIDSAVAAAPVLAAPTTAIFTDASGRSHLTLANGEKRGDDVPVKLGECVEGWCQVTSEGAALTAGTTVVAGIRGAGTA
ncbi:peptidoglycan-binding domain-containing protein [Krasilnikovia sp. M28-CT-15]|uniref:peptidoglycan-binding domain-containing protein n=1 Tax=Krasilnikovia sp. M28-CT-15 TaxID=3373540 RepID=UPI003875B02A